MIYAQKAALHAELKARRAAISDQIRAERNERLWKNTLTMLTSQTAIRTLLLYAPTANEISLIPIFHYARARGITCAFPRCEGEKGKMNFYYVSDLRDLSIGKYGIREPNGDALPVTDFSDAVVFVPALAIDHRGHRIGYGGGYYDRFLAKHPIHAVGVTYEEFLVDSLPYDEFDVSVSTVITERRILPIKQ